MSDSFLHPHLTVLSDSEGNNYRVSLIDGRPLPMFVTKEGLEGVKAFDLRDDDVFLVNFPKAGTHWLHEMLHMFNIGSTTYAKATKGAAMLEFGQPAFDALNKQETRRIINSHLLPDELPEQLFNSKAKIILTYRNPKDTLVSYYHHVMSLKEIYGYEGTWNSFFETKMSKALMEYGDQFEHLKAWLDQVNKYPEKFIVVSYESLKLDTFGELKRITDFLEMSSSDEFLQQVVDACTIDRLRSDVKKRKSFMDSSASSEPLAKIFRKGIIGDWKNQFTVSQNERFQKLIDEGMKDIVLPQPFIYE